MRMESEMTDNHCEQAVKISGDRLVAAVDAATEGLCAHIDRATWRMAWVSAIITTLGLAVFFAVNLS